MRLLLLALSLLTLACGDATGPPATAVARFAPSFDAPMDWADVPFPSELYRDEAGTIRLGALPTPLSDAPLFVAMRELLATRDGFCATCNVYFAIDGDLAPGQAGSAAARGQGDPSPFDEAVLVDVDPDSPERGSLFALRTQWDATSRVFALRPERGIALHRSRRYAAAITSSLRAADGTPLGASDAFGRVRDRKARGDAASARVVEVIEPALDELERAGVERDRVVALAVFVTEDVTADALALRAAVQEGPALAVRVERTWQGPELDELLGTPYEDRPGIDVPPADGSDGTRSIVHRSIARVVAGAFEAPRFPEGTGSEIGLLRRDAAGRLAPGPRESVPFVLTIPAGADPSSLPVAVAHHGFNASRTTGFATAEAAARAGVAVFAIDAFQHGERAASARDDVNAMRGGIPGADGFAETEPLDVSARVFGVVGAAPGLEGFAGYSQATLLQFSADVAAAVRVLREPALGAAVGVGIEASRIGFIGNSLGAVVGSTALVVEPDIRAAVQNVPPGSIIETLAESPEFRPLVEVVFLPRLGVSGPFDEVERQLVFDPAVDLSRWIIEPADPLAMAPYLLRDRVVEGEPPQVLFQVATLDEVAATLATSSMLDAIGSSRITRYDPAAHGMLEVLEQVSLLEPPAAPPFVRRPAPLAVVNPLVAEHLEIESFLREFLASAADP